MEVLLRNGILADGREFERQDVLLKNLPAVIDKAATKIYGFFFKVTGLNTTLELVLIKNVVPPPSTSAPSLNQLKVARPPSEASDSTFDGVRITLVTP